LIQTGRDIPPDSLSLMLAALMPVECADWHADERLGTLVGSFHKSCGWSIPVSAGLSIPCIFGLDGAFPG
jgi:hypothetical protein